LEGLEHPVIIARQIFLYVFFIKVIRISSEANTREVVCTACKQGWVLRLFSDDSDWTPLP